MEHVFDILISFLKVIIPYFSPFLLIDIHLTMYRQIEVVIWTHAIGGLTQSDFILAREMEKIKVDYSPKWLETHGDHIRNRL